MEAKNTFCPCWSVWRREIGSLAVPVPVVYILFATNTARLKPNSISEKPLPLSAPTKPQWLEDLLLQISVYSFNSLFLLNLVEIGKEIDQGPFDLWFDSHLYYNVSRWSRFCAIVARRFSH